MIGTILFTALTGAASLGVFAQTQSPSDTRYDEPIRRLERQLEQLRRLRDREVAHQHAHDRTVDQLQKLGARIERDVVAINLVATKVTDDDLKSLGVFPNLQALHLHHTSISDAGLANLKDLKHLNTLDVFDTRVTDAGLEHLAEWMPHLEELEVSDTRITDAGLRPLKELKYLRRLGMQNTRVTAAGIDDLHRALPGLEIHR
jgi:hypothetical protein